MATWGDMIGGTEGGEGADDRSVREYQAAEKTVGYTVGELFYFFPIWGEMFANLRIMFAYFRGFIYVVVVHYIYRTFQPKKGSRIRRTSCM